MTSFPPATNLPESLASPAEAWSEELAGCWQALVETVRQRLGTPAPLAPEVRRTFEGLLGEDVSQVLVHQGGFPALVAAEARASAVSIDGHVLGGSSQLDTGTVRGTALLGHEATHAVAQMGRTPVLATAAPEPVRPQ